MKKSLVVTSVLAFSLFVFECASLTKRSIDGNTMTFVIALDNVSPLSTGTIKDNTFEDTIIKADFVVSMDMEQIAFTIKNKSDKTLKIDWNNAAYIDPDGISHKVIHDSKKIIKKEQTQMPSVIVSGSLITDAIVPIDFISYTTEEDWYNSIGWKLKQSTDTNMYNVIKEKSIGWKFKQILKAYKYNPDSNPDYDVSYNAMYGHSELRERERLQSQRVAYCMLEKTIKLLLPVIRDKEITEYIFSFKISGVIEQ